MSSMAKKKLLRRVICTGMTFDEVGHSIKDTHHRMLEGVKEGAKIRRCYLCKRWEGSKIVSIDAVAEEFYISRLKLFDVEVELGTQKNLVFFLCQECRLLLSHLIKERY